MRVRALLAIVAVASFAAACGPKVDLAKGLQVVDVSTGWFDAGIVEGQNKIVPTLSFALKNISDQKLVVLDVNVSFRRVGETADWDTSLVTVAGTDGLAPGATSKRFTVDSKQGYKGTDTRAQMLTNAQFVDANAVLFAKYANTQWARIGEFPVTRKFVTK
jgi:hypothetical protein